MLKNIFNNIGFEVTAYFRFFDDTYAIINKDNIERFVNLFNNYHQRLIFMHEKEKDGRLNFLDVRVVRDNHNMLIVDWYHKTTFSGRYFNYFSNHNMSTKVGIIKSIVTNEIQLSHHKFHNKNMKLIKECLIHNSGS